MSESLFAVGQRVRVSWFNGPVVATVVEVERRGGRLHKIPLYRVSIDGVDGTLGYREDEMESL